MVYEWSFFGRFFCGSAHPNDTICGHVVSTTIQLQLSGSTAFNWIPRYWSMASADNYPPMGTNVHFLFFFLGIGNLGRWWDVGTLWRFDMAANPQEMANANY